MAKLSSGNTRAVSPVPRAMGIGHAASENPRISRRWQAIAWSLSLAFALIAPWPCFGQTFTEATNLVGLWAGPLECGDFDNDGRLDLMGSGYDVSGTNGWVGRTQIYRSVGNCAFALLGETGLPAG